MAEYAVSNEIELGEAVWHSGPGDTVRFLAGHYGRVIVKGCDVYFPEDRSVTIGQLVGGGVVRNATVRNNRGAIFVYRKLLPFNLRVKPNEPYYHPSGAAVTLLGHDKEMGGPIGFSTPAQEQLPRAIVDVEVPRCEQIDFAILKAHPSGSGANWQSYLQEERKLQDLLKGDPAGLRFGDVEYNALWALNHFLRQYAAVAKSRKITGLSLAEFRDGRTLAYGPWSNAELSAHDQVFIDEYHGIPFTPEEQHELQDLCLASKDYSVSEYIEVALERLNYSMAVVGMAQLLEANGLTGSWWETLQASRLTGEQQRHIAELMICRNVILHQRGCAVKDNAQGFDGVRQRFAVEPLSEYRVYATKRPWYWYREGILPYLRTRSTTNESEIPELP